MNVVSLAQRMVGCFGTVGGSIAAATGTAAMSLQRSGSGVAVAFFGDGALNQAYFHECINLAAVQQLPLVLVCENNLYGEFTPMSKVTAGDVLRRASAYGVEAWSVDGNDVWAVNELAKKARARAIAGHPIFIEALTYRFNDHARGDPVAYRPPGELEAWRERDPLTIAEDRLRDDYRLSEEELKAVGKEIAEWIERCRSSALADDLPDPDSWTASEFKS